MTDIQVLENWSLFLSYYPERGYKNYYKIFICFAWLQKDLPYVALSCSIIINIVATHWMWYKKMVFMVMKGETTDLLWHNRRNKGLVVTQTRSRKTRKGCSFRLKLHDYTVGIPNWNPDTHSGLWFIFLQQLPVLTADTRELSAKSLTQNCLWLGTVAPACYYPHPSPYPTATDIEKRSNTFPTGKSLVEDF